MVNLCAAVGLALLPFAAPPTTSPVRADPVVSAAELALVADHVQRLQTHQTANEQLNAVQSGFLAAAWVLLLALLLRTERLRRRLNELNQTLSARASAPAARNPEPEPPRPVLPAPEPQPEPPSQPAARADVELADELAQREDLPPEAARLMGLVNYARELPPAAEAALAAGEAAGWVRAHQVELDRALFERVSADEAVAALAGVTGEAAARTLAEWLSAQQTTAARRLAEQGLERITTSPGSPFEEGRVVLDAEAPPVATTRSELAGRVAGVRPGRGGWELAGQVLVPTRAQVYEVREGG